MYEQLGQEGAGVAARSNVELRVEVEGSAQLVEPLRPGRVVDQRSALDRSSDDLVVVQWDCSLAESSEPWVHEPDATPWRAGGRSARGRLCSVSERPQARAGSAYLVRPGDDGASPGPGVLVLHSWWGLTAGVKAYCNRLCDEGFAVLAPDLLDGLAPQTAAEAEFELARTDPNATAGLVLSSTVALRSLTDDPSGPIAVIGFSMGVSWALWAAIRQPESFRRVVAYYGVQSLAVDELTADVLAHFPEHDDLIGDEELTDFEARLFEARKDPEIWHYPGTRHFFAEEAGDAFDAPAAALAWDRTLAFLRR